MKVLQSGATLSGPRIFAAYRFAGGGAEPLMVAWIRSIPLGRLVEQ